MIFRVHEHTEFSACDDCEQTNNATLVTVKFANKSISLCMACAKILIVRVMGECLLKCLPTDELLENKEVIHRNEGS